MPTVDVYDTSGNKLSKMTLSREIFGIKPDDSLMAQAVRVYLANQRKAMAKTKGRSDVNASGKKIWRQKGTGRARHGDRKAPIFVKGGVAHGPTGEQNYKLKMSKKQKKQALFSSLSSKFKDKEVIVVDGLEKVKPKTKEMAKITKNLKLPTSPRLRGASKTKSASWRTKFKITFILPSVLENIIRAGRNIPEVEFLQTRQLNTYEVLNGGMLVFMKESIGMMKETFGKRNKK